MAARTRNKQVEPLLRRLAHYVQLEQDDVQAIQGCLVRTRKVAKGERLVEEGDRPDHVNVVLRGYVARYKSLHDGRRQITALFLDGDLFDLRLYVLDRMDHGVTALTAAEVAYIPRDQLLAVSDERPRLARAFWTTTMVNDSITAEWLVNVGRRTASERLAHLICEVYWRRASVGGADPETFELPFTQAVIGDMLALSAVHMSRSVGRLRELGLVSGGRSAVKILDLAALEQHAGFDGDYLHLKP